MAIKFCSNFVGINLWVVFFPVVRFLCRFIAHKYLIFLDVGKTLSKGGNFFFEQLLGIKVFVEAIMV